jgi:hypothetical protein
MKAMRNLGLVVAGLLLGSLGCEGPASAPAKPTWVDDVEPILRGNCFHCHGAVSPDAAPLVQRWDFYDMGDPKLTTINDFTPTDVAKAKWPSAKDHLVSWLLYVTYTADNPARMPPAPATPLSDSAIQTLKNWMMAGTPRGTRLNNKKPTAAWLVRPKTIVVSDDDNEQVLGKMTCSGADEPVAHSGTFTLPAGWQPPCTATLYDGQDTQMITLQ